MSADQQPGRSCPIDYRYSPSQIAKAPVQERGAVYAAGGLYGNLASIDSIEGLLERDPCANTELIFNGDFHWFDAELDWFTRVEQRTAKHTRIRGNVETEFLRESDIGAGCGCAYPDGVDEAFVNRSNRIAEALSAVAKQYAKNHSTSAPSRGPTTANWPSLPMFAVREVAGQRVAIVHGDAWSLSGWEFNQGFTHESIAAVCAEAGVHLFFSSHTCEPAVLIDPQGRYGLLNNGTAGMPSLFNPPSGLVCRIGSQPHPDKVILRWHFGKAWVEWLPVACQKPVFTERFLARWPVGTDANVSYGDRVLAQNFAYAGCCPSS